MIILLFALFIGADPVTIAEPKQGSVAGLTRFVIESGLPEKEIAGIEVLVNGKLVHYFEEAPFETEVDFGGFPHGPIRIRVVLSRFDGINHVKEMITENIVGFYEEEVNLVRIPVMVNLPLSNRTLRAEDFTVSENGTEQKIDLLYSSEKPLDLVVVIDLSGSMEKRVAVLRHGIIRLLETLRPGDRVQIIGFNNRVFEISPPETDKEKVKKRLYGLEADGSTNLYGAVWSGVKILGNSRMRRALLVFTDGYHDLGSDQDNYNKDLTACVDYARTVGVPIYTMGVGFGIKPEILKELSETTGGKYFFLNSARSVREAFATMGGDMRHQYLVCYHTQSTQTGWYYLRIKLPEYPDVNLLYPTKMYFH